MHSGKIFEYSLSSNTLLILCTDEHMRSPVENGLTQSGDFVSAHQFSRFFIPEDSLTTSVQKVVCETPYKVEQR
jgi:hypothetical protein